MSVEEISPPEAGEVDLSVVVIAENEEEHIRECLDSIFEACRVVPSFEVILVDSASTDRTVTYASEYPITILRIPEEQTVSCGAGRYVGDHSTSGRLVLHVDGDMTLRTDWLPLAIQQLEDASVAGVEGNLDASTQTGIREVDKVGGVMLYNASALAEVGGFDPYLLGYEDVELGYRLREAGYTLLRLPQVSATHHEEDTVSEPLRRYRQGYLTAPGQTIRKWVRSPRMLRRLLIRQGYKLGLAGWLLVGLVSMLSWAGFLAWLGLSIVGFGVVARKQGAVGAVRFFLVKGMGVIGLLEGFRTPTPDADRYPIDAVEIIREGQVHEGSLSTDAG